MAARTAGAQLAHNGAPRAQFSTVLKSEGAPHAWPLVWMHRPIANGSVRPTGSRTPAVWLPLLGCDRAGRQGRRESVATPGFGGQNRPS